MNSAVMRSTFIGEELAALVVAGRLACAVRHVCVAGAHSQSFTEVATVPAWLSGQQGTSTWASGQVRQIAGGRGRRAVETTALAV